jgi:hypothetical protein
VPFKASTVRPTKEDATVIRKLPISLAVASLLFALPYAAFAQTPAPVPAPPPPAPPASEPPQAAPAPTMAPPAPEPPLQMPPSSTMPPAPPGAMPSSPGGVAVELTSLRLLREKGIITAAEYESALHDLVETAGSHAGSEGTVVVGKWSTTLYGFVESDSIWDTTRSFNDLAGGAPVARSGTAAGDQSRFTEGVRNSRIGFKLRAPETNGIRTSAMLEMDFLGTQLPVGVLQPYQGTEGAFFTNPTFRIRHFNLKVETPVVDILAGQYWQLFGWQSSYQPNTVEIQGVPGELYARTPQVRISKTLKAYPVSVDLAVAAVRPVQRDSGIPDGEAGLRFAVDSWTGVQTVGATGTQISPLSVAATGLMRRVEVNQFTAKPDSTSDLTMSAFAVDGFLPIVPGTKESKDNSLSFNGEFATGYGFADMYTGLTGGIVFPTLPPPANLAAGATAPTYTPDIDNGIVTYDSKGKLHGIQWTSFLVGAQYYLPGVDGKVWISGNYSHISSDNTHYYVTAAAPTSAVRAGEDWFDVNLFFDPVNAIRVGLEYANFNDRYVDGQHAINHRGQLSGFFVF